MPAAIAARRWKRLSVSPHSASPVMGSAQWSLLRPLPARRSSLDKNFCRRQRCQPRGRIASRRCACVRRAQAMHGEIGDHTRHLGVCHARLKSECYCRSRFPVRSLPPSFRFSAGRTRPSETGRALLARITMLIHAEPIADAPKTADAWEGTVISLAARRNAAALKTQPCHPGS